MNDSKQTTVYIAGPHWSPEERAGLQGISDLMERHGFASYLPHRDGLEELYWLHGAGADAPQRSKGAEELLRHALFATEVCRIVRRCQALVCVLNGRVPDEGAVFKAALAYAVGTPLVICKNDNRSAFHGSDNAMVTGLTRRFKTVKSLSSLAAELDAAIRSHARQGGRPAEPAPLKDVLDLGDRIIGLADGHRGRGEDRLPGRIAPLRAELARAVNGTAGSAGSAGSAGGRTVYCSGPLFCPEELGLMADIARVIERAGNSTFLPQRDGVEAFVMNRVDSPVANAWILGPVRALVNRAVFALDIFQIIERCDSFVFNMNGRVPDEGGVVETAVAFALGRRPVIYNGDRRSLAAGRPHPLIVSAAQAVLDDISRLPEAVAGMTTGRVEAALLPPQVKKTVDFGRRVWKLLGRIGFLRPKNALLS